MAEVTESKHIVLLLPGIESIGEWQSFFESTVRKYYKELSPFTVVPLDYGIPSRWSLLTESGRSHAVDRFIAEYEKQREQHGPDAEFSAVAHSFGCWALCEAVRKSKNVVFRNIVFVSGVLPRTLDWNGTFRLKKNNPAFRLILNYTAYRDWQLLLALLILGEKFSVGGLHGLRGVDHNVRCNVPVVGGHSSILESEEILVNNNFPFLARGEFPPPQASEKPQGVLVWIIKNAYARSWLLKFIVISAIVISAIFIIVIFLYMQTTCDTAEECLKPLDFARTMVTRQQTPRKGQCGVETVRNLSYDLGRVRWMRVTLRAPSDLPRKSYVGWIMIEVERKSGWEFLGAQPFRQGDVWADNAGNVPYSLGWSFTITSDSMFGLLVCAHHGVTDVGRFENAVQVSGNLGER